MRLPRLPRPALPILAALLTMWALRRTLRSLGESLVPLLRRSAAASGLEPLLSLIPALLVFALTAAALAAAERRRATAQTARERPRVRPLGDVPQRQHQTVRPDERRRARTTRDR